MPNDTGVHHVFAEYARRLLLIQAWLGADLGHGDTREQRDDKRPALT